MKQKKEPSIFFCERARERQCYHIYMLNKLFANSAGALGYLAGGLGWTWALALILTSVSWLQDIAPEPRREPTLDLIPKIELSPSSSEIIGLIVVAVMVLITIYVILRLPVVASKTASKTAKQAADNIVKSTIKKPLKEADKKRLSAKIVLYIKLILTLLPALLILILIVWPGVKLELASDIIVMISASLAGFGLVCFLAQHLIAKWRKLDPSQLL